jgi:DNA-nicking Smr family endonuclease
MYTLAGMMALASVTHALVRPIQLTPKTVVDVTAAPLKQAEVALPSATAPAAPTKPDTNRVDSFGNLVDENGGRVWPDAYYTARKEAEQHAIERGNCFEAAKKAFDADKKAEAKALSDKGKAHGEQMEEANKRAAAVILGPQNLDQGDKIDIHGLLLKEAVDATRDFVKGSVGKKATVEVITGQGLHSDEAKGPVIKPAIIAMCEEEKWQIGSDPANPGSFTVHVPSA